MILYGGRKYYRIDSYRLADNLFELWEDCQLGDEAPSLLTLNGVVVDCTCGCIEDAIDDFYEIM